MLTVYGGQGESSKTTFVKHLEWIYGPGFPTEEREVWRNIIHDDLLTAYHGLQRAYEKKCPYGIELENDIWVSLNSPINFHPRVMRIELASGDQPELFQSAFPYVFKRLVDESADIVMRNGGAGSLPDNIDYFVNHLVRICDINYIPTGGDILRARTRTTGIHRYTYTSPDYKSFQVYDVGGERSERKKCIKVFDQSAVVLLFVPIDSYDQILYEDENTNRMQEALTLFKSLVNTEDWWKESRMSLCFTKCDLFEKKIQSGSTPLNVYFPEYAGSPTDVAECRKYITWRFTQLLEQRSELGVFYLDVTDTGHVREVVETSLGGGYSTSPRYNHFDRRGDSLHENVTRI
ncbi:G-alpha-domain-containing protein [Bimuria novae-zelandiae CBS 107.79]|uniref:G-alpha-domain-containing protein n=1 Tax=Bimuria novae-zelandiae CBS 107.79 TaxID=1447943 RepID=A0A6A5UL41_9PLEO|nr:G-alpha-domain-containing protein [Bimuria novae-zelandiae CBS 107.79]